MAVGVRWEECVIMDPVTQGAWGALWAQTQVDQKKDAWLGTVIGALAGMAPDLDVFIRSETNPMLAIEYHRHFTHSLFFAPLGGLLLATIIYPLVYRWVTYKKVVVWSILGWLSHAVIDCCTTYGTMWLWPFYQARIAWDTMPIIDFCYTIPLLVMVFLFARYYQRRWLSIGLIWMVLVPILGGFQHQRGVAALQQLAAHKGHEVERYRVMPSPLNLVVWRAIYLTQGTVVTQGLRIPPLGSVTYYPGGEKKLWQGNSSELTGSKNQQRDIDVFRHFSDDWLTVVSLTNTVTTLGDLRYASDIESVNPMWTIEVDQREGHVRRGSSPEETSREELSQRVKALWDRVVGNDPGEPIPSH